VLRLGDLLARALGEQRRQRHLGAHPARHDRRARRRGLDPRGHLAHAHELEHAPANTKQSFGRSRSMNDSSTWPSALPFDIRTVMLASGDDRADLHPVAVRDLASGTRAMPSVADHDAPVLGYALRLAPPCTTKSSTHCQCASLRSR
jgi:hypothetical protein